MDKDEAEAITSAVRGVIRSSIASLQAIGMTHDDACRLLIVQGSAHINRDDDGLKRCVEDYLESKISR